MRIDEKLLPIAEKYGNLANLVYWDILEFDDDLDEYLEKDYGNNYYIRNEYIEDDGDFEKIAELCFQLKEELKGCIYNEDRKDYLELSDSHTLWKTNGDIDIDEYIFIVDDYLKRFESMTDTEVFALGRSGRHICVEDNLSNAIRFDELCTIQNNLEEELISEINSGKYNSI